MEALTSVSSWDAIMKSICAKLHFWSITDWQKNSSFKINRIATKESTISPAYSIEAKQASEGQTCGQPLLAYPNCDLAIWLRTCEKEVVEPLDGVTSGIIPPWIRGSLFRNGPGKQKYGRQTVNHLFDASGLLHL